jgi:hypothetical protein
MNLLARVVIVPEVTDTGSSHRLDNCDARNHSRRLKIGTNQHQDLRMRFVIENGALPEAHGAVGGERVVASGGIVFKKKLKNQAKYSIWKCKI